jgi:hypothetical protein
MIAPISGQSAYTTLQFSTTYASQNFLVGGDSAGYLGQNAYGNLFLSLCYLVVNTLLN